VLDQLAKFIKALITQKFQPFNFEWESVGLGCDAGGLIVHTFIPWRALPLLWRLPLLLVPPHHADSKIS
jgi:hypothetical protein